MTIKNRTNFNRMVDLCVSEAGGQALRPVIEKELLHYEIFAALLKENLLKDLVFQGGTSLRLCRGSNRFSEDLDFVGGREFSANDYTNVKTVLEEHIVERFGLDIIVKEPNGLSESEDGLHVDKWMMAVQTSPERPDLPKQRIKIEIANVASYDNEVAMLQANYSAVERGYGQMLVRAETLDEVLADKMLAYPMADYLRHRDIWDMAWLLQQRGIEKRFDLLRHKIIDYGNTEEAYLNVLEERIRTLPDVIHSKAFYDQMARFIQADVLSQTLDQEGFLDYLNTTVSSLLKDVKESFDPAPGPAFKM